jgi:adenine-specific DNA-methyltransferase
MAAEGERLVVNPESHGRFHSDWLSMIYGRLKLARNLLRDDGAIFITIDDGEHANLKKICDEIFGETNFFANIVWQSKDTAGHCCPVNHRINSIGYNL